MVTTNRASTQLWFRDINAAVQHFYENDMARGLPKSAATTQIDLKKAEALFNKY